MPVTDSNKNNSLSRARRAVAAVLAVVSMTMLLPSVITGQAQAQKPKPTSVQKPDPRFLPQKRKIRPDDENHVILQHADRAFKLERDTFETLVGNVVFTCGAMEMYCDSAKHFSGSESFQAFGNVKMLQADTIQIYADELFYNGIDHIAYLYGKEFPKEDVRMINKDVILVTPTFTYDVTDDFGYYTEGGTLTEGKTWLFSRYGEYSPSTKDAFFTDEVKLHSESQEQGTTVITADSLFYNTATHVAILRSNGKIDNKDGRINTEYGTYNTETDIAHLYERSTVISDSTGTTLIGDSLFYDGKNKYGRAFGNVVIDNPEKRMVLTGDYGYYNETEDSALVTEKALAKYWDEQKNAARDPDTLYLHAKYIYAIARYDSVQVKADTILGTRDTAYIDTTHVLIAKQRARFYRKDMQGICDSLRYQQVDSMIYMFHNPMVWSGNRQVWGNEIQVLLDSTSVRQATLPDNGFTAEEVAAPKFFNQMKGKKMTAHFDEKGQLREVNIDGNVEAIMFPEEVKEVKKVGKEEDGDEPLTASHGEAVNDTIINKMVYVNSGFLTAYFENQEIQKAIMWPQTDGKVTPLFLIDKKTMTKLPGFQWRQDLRPMSPDSLLFRSEAMESYFEEYPVKDMLPRPDRATLEKFITAKAAADEPANTEEPTVPETEAPATEAPAAEEPANDNPVIDEPANDNPAADEPATEEPNTIKPTTEEPDSGELQL